ncbi:MAG: biotin/lipoyl-containing protein, partial [Pirellula sp.]
MTPIVVPAVGESISEVQISQWLKKEGEWVAAGTDLVDLETEKASVQVSAPVDGILVRILKPNDQFATVGEAIAEFQPAAKSAASAPSAPAPAAGPSSTAQPAVVASAGSNGDVRVMPAARRMAGDLGMSPESIPGTGPGGRV